MSERLEEVRQKLIRGQQDLDRELPTARRAHEALLSAIRRVDASWSKSFAGYHASLYYRDFQPPPLEDSFSPEWGGVDGLPDGWEERLEEEVVGRIEELAQSSVETLEGSSRRFRDEAKVLSQSALIATSLLRGEGALRADTALVTRVESPIQGPTPESLLRGIQSQDRYTRDSFAASQGQRIPVHLRYQARATAALRQLESAQALLQDAERLVIQAQLHVEHRAQEGQTDTHMKHPEGGPVPDEGNAPDNASHSARDLAQRSLSKTPGFGVAWAIGGLASVAAWMVFWAKGNPWLAFGGPVVLLLLMGFATVILTLSRLPKQDTNRMARALAVAFTGAVICLLIAGVTLLTVFAFGALPPRPIEPNKTRSHEGSTLPVSPPDSEGRKSTEPAPTPTVRPASNSDFEFIVERCSVDAPLDPNHRARVNFSVTPEVNGNPVASKQRPYTFDVDELTATDETPGGFMSPITGSVPAGGTLCIAFGPKEPTFLRSTGVSNPGRVDPLRFPDGATLQVGEQALQKVITIRHPTDPSHWPQVTVQFSVRWTRVSGVTEVSYNRWKALLGPKGEEGVEWISDSIPIPVGMGTNPQITLEPHPALQPQGNLFRPEDPQVLHRAGDPDFRIRLSTKGPWRLGAENPQDEERWRRMVKDVGLSVGWTVLREPAQLPDSKRIMILAADPKMDVYLISVGSEQGVSVGDELTVSREGRFVAMVIVETVYMDKASVTVKKQGGKPFKKADIAQGDTVTRAE